MTTTTQPTEPKAKPKTPETETGSHEGPAYKKGIEAVRLAHQQSVADQIARQSSHNEDMRQAINSEAIPGLKSDEGGEMGSQLNIDSPTTVNHHYHSEPADEPAKPKRKKRLGTIAKLAVGAGLMATGAGTMAGASMIWDAIKNREQVEKPADPTPEPAKSSRERKYSLDLGD